MANIRRFSNQSRVILPVGVVFVFTHTIVFAGNWASFVVSSFDGHSAAGQGEAATLKASGVNDEGSLGER